MAAQRAQVMRAQGTAQPDLAAAPWAVGFFQALRRVEVAHPRQPRLGTAARPADEPVRLGQDPSLAFAPAALASFRPAEGEVGGGQGASRLGVAFFGLFGPMGPLPLHLTELAGERQRPGEGSALGRFADIFHHRLLTMFYRAWADAEPVVSRDRPAEDAFARQLASLIGLGLPSLSDRDAVPDSFKLAFAGRLVAHARNPEGLAAMLVAALDVPVRIEEFVGGYVTIEPEDRWRLGLGQRAGALGSGAFLGRRVYCRDQKFRVVIGPVDRDAYDGLLPGGADLARVRAIVRGYIGDELDWDVQLIGNPEVRRPMQLGRRGRLGYSGWLGPRADLRPLQDVVFSPCRVRPLSPGENPCPRTASTAPRSFAS
jgi:type VI secretion system protein ImpH